MGPTAKYRGLNHGTSGVTNAPPTAPGNGSGGAGTLAGLGTQARTYGSGAINDALAGRVTLALINLTILGMVGFYIWTRSTQNGG